MAIRITEDGTVIYENEPDIDRELFPNIPISGVTPEEITQAVNKWLEDHPEATTTVEDGSITKTKLDSNLQTELDSMDSDIGELKENFSELVKQNGINIFNANAVNKNTFLNATSGTEEPNVNYNASGFIPCDADANYTVRTFTYTGTPSYRVYFYNSEKEFIERVTYRVTNSRYVFTTPVTAAYLRLNFETGSNVGGTQDETTTVLVYGNTAITEYIPYYTVYDETARIILRRDALLTGRADYTTTDANDLDANRIYYITPNRITTNYPKLLTAAYIVTIPLSDNNKLQLAYSAYGTAAQIRSCVNGVWGEWRHFAVSKQPDIYVTSTIALFPSVGCCGDSFTAGYLYNKPESDYYDPNYAPNGEYPAIGYPAVMGRLYGIDVTAYAKGGLTSTAYRTDAKGLPALLTDEPKYLYIIALGLNDKTQGIPIGIEADIDTEPSTPTYLGNMGAIIRAIKAHAPYARIILCKSLWMNTSYYNYVSDGVNLLSSHLGIPFIETLGDPYFESSAYKNGLKGLHPTAPLYAGIGKRIGELVGNCVIDNPEYFYNFYVPND